jgi:hypothetical protein
MHGPRSTTTSQHLYAALITARVGGDSRRVAFVHSASPASGYTSRHQWMRGVRGQAARSGIASDAANMGSEPMTTASNGPSWTARANHAASVQALLPSRGSGRFCVHAGRKTR